MLASFDDYLHAKQQQQQQQKTNRKKSKYKNKYHLILSTDIDNLRILQSDWIKGTTSHIQSKEDLSHAILT